MATQQVKFHSVTASQYNSATKSDGSLYFITDNGEIRKGSSHITGTRVFTATDATGTTAVGSLTISINGTEITAEGAEQPKRGDMLVVKHVLTYTGEEPNLVEDKVEYSAYIYGANGGVYSADGWRACDGNVDASRVILTQDITLAGNYTEVGNIQKSDNTFATSGISVADALQQIFTKELQPGTPTNPSFTLTGPAESVEVGTTYPSKTYTGTWNDGSYQYKAWVSDGNVQTATGAAVGEWTITAYDGKTEEDATISGNTATIQTDPIVVESAASYTLVTFNVTNDVTNVLPAATNLKKKSNPEKKITKTTNTAQSKKVTGFRYWFHGSNTTVKDYTTVDGEGKATVAVNDNIRALTKVTALTSMNVVQNATQVVIAIPANKTLTKVTDGGALNAEITGNFIEKAVKVGGADSETGVSIGSYPGNYKVYVMTPSAPLDARTYTITIS